MRKLVALVTFGLSLAVLLSASPSQSSDFKTLVAQYRGAGADQAVAQVATWSDARATADAVLPQSSDPWDRAAGALLLLEAGLRRLGFQSDSGHALWFGSVGRVVHSTGGAWVKDLAAQPGTSSNRTLREFCRDYFVILQVALVSPDGRQGRSNNLEQVQRSLADDPGIHLLVGTVAAGIMGPIRSGEGGVYAYGSFDPSLKGASASRTSALGEEYATDEVRLAERSLRQALELDPTLAEGHLRLGRLFQLLNRRADAERHLGQASRLAADQADPLTGYLAELFIADLHKDAGQLPEAMAAYGRAVTKFPSGYVARLALGQALVETGAAEQGWSMSRTVFAPDVQPPTRDPLSRFRAPSYGRITARLAAMRAKVSQTPLSRTIAVPTASVPVRESAQLSPPLDEPTVQSASRAPAFRATVEAIRVDLLVLQDGRPVTGLAASDFLVTDNGVAQRVDNVAQTDSLAAAIVLDTSSSMSEGDQWSNAQRALSALGRALTPRDTFSVFTVSDRLALRGDLLQSPEGLGLATASVRPERNAGSALWDSVFAASSLVAESAGRAIVVLVSDGWDNVSWFDRRDATRRFARLGVTVDAIHIPFRTSPNTQDIAFGDVRPASVIGPTGGLVIPGDLPDLPAKLVDRLGQLRQSYILTYTPANVKPQKDGWHDIKVTLRAGVKGNVQGRPGYYARVKK